MLTRLGKAAIAGDLELIKTFIEEGDDIHERNDYAVRWAAANGKLEAVKYLVEKGAYINAGDGGALSNAIMFKQYEVVTYLKRKMLKEKLLAL